MTGTPFHMTRRGAKFYDADVPRLIGALERVADRLAEHAMAPVPDTDTEPRERPLTPDQRRALCGPFPVSGSTPCAVDGCDKVAGQAVFCDEHRANVMRYGYAVPPCPDTDTDQGVVDTTGTMIDALDRELADLNEALAGVRIRALEPDVRHTEDGREITICLTTENGSRLDFGLGDTFGGGANAGHLRLAIKGSTESHTDAHHVRRGLARAAKLVRAIDPKSVVPDGDGNTAIGRAALVAAARILETHAASYGRNK